MCFYGCFLCIEAEIGLLRSLLRCFSMTDVKHATLCLCVCLCVCVCVCERERESERERERRFSRPARTRPHHCASLIVTQIEGF